MTDLNKKLLALAAALMVLAFLTYRHDTSRADRFETGQKFLQNLNPDDVAKIEVRGAAEDNPDTGDAVTLTRQGDEYAVAERNGYVARNEEVNRLVRDLLDISLDRRMGSGEELAAELGLTGSESTSVTLSSANGDVMVSVDLGTTSDSGGRYVRRSTGEDQSIYRTEAALTVSSDPGTFLNKEIMDHPSSAIVRIEGPDFVLAKQQDDDGQWQGVLELEGAEAKASEVNRLTSLLARLSFEEVFLASAPEVASLRFATSHTFNLDDQSGYVIESATQGDDTFIRVRGLFNVDRLEVSQDETDEQLEEKADVLRRSEEIAQFDQYHGSWVYKLSSSDGEKFAIARAALVE